MSVHCTPQMREAVASLSTGTLNPTFAGGRAPHYDEFSHWWDRLVETLLARGFEPDHEMPTPHSGDGRGIVRCRKIEANPPGGWDQRPIDDTPWIAYMWYRMDTTHRWEIICYVC